MVVQRIETALGTLELDLPGGAVLRPDPGTVEGAAWYWSPQRDTVVTISTGDAELRTPAALLALEGSLDGVAVQVLRDEPGATAGEHHLMFRSAPPRVAGGPAGHRAPDSTVHQPAQLARFRFWQRSGAAVRLGYRLDERTGAAWRARLDRLVDGARWP